MEGFTIGTVTATATDPAGNTSEFSLAVTNQYIPPLIVNDPGDAPLDPSMGSGETVFGTITLRSAIEQANIDDISGELIGFTYPMDISVFSQLDTITAAGLTIDGSTSGGDVELSGSSIFDGIVIGSSGDTIENLQINGFNNGIRDFGGSNLIQNNFVFDNNSNGVEVQGASDDQIVEDTITSNLENGVLLSGASANVIGAPGEGDLLSGNGGSGLLILGGDNNLVQGNFLVGTGRHGRVSCLAMRAESKSALFPLAIRSAEPAWGPETSSRETLETASSCRWVILVPRVPVRLT